MDQNEKRQLSPYRAFTNEEWATLRADTPMTLTGSDLEKIKSLNDPISLQEVEEIYLPLSRLLSYYVEFARGLNNATQHFLGTNEPKTPFIIGVAGSVSVGKSTTARLLQALLSRWSASPQVDLITTDGFLLPNAVLNKEGLMRRKGFPESYDRTALIQFLTDIKAGKRNVRAPVYSHFYYDVMPDEHVIIDQPDILILEGLNVLQTGILPKDGKEIPFVSDFFDFSIYIDADEDILHRWYLERFMRLRETAFRDSESYFHRYSLIEADEADKIANDLWASINLVNLRENIFPTRPRADLVLGKDDSHAIKTVMLRKL
ncbi:type I pantothenate kinase [Cohaesibacter celericrescens]|uniref:Pantothenate kinase n=1 Tax=Cohaesibacter celericrescens TaxID=2067669 RepID=A0A2N5XP28_9HYPH|nr:type I pantothenate kinase [Cohaesibacter celericrescens]PLW76235.1 type I pantothenate kinase [Cohaesibacter celericrescens]